MSYTFRPGMKVVCVDAAYNDHSATGPDWPLVKNAVYIIETVTTCWNGTQGVRLVGANWHGLVYYATRFRPVAEKPTAMEMIRSIVAGGPITETGEPRLPSPVHEYDGFGGRI